MGAVQRAALLQWQYAAIYICLKASLLMNAPMLISRILGAERIADDMTQDINVADYLIF